ncbi:hypothetical protein AF72_02440 [Xylella taiwanensis]|uniref:Uncharacterized protein n=1 Tax=Xylella taiwanensis TaxID=1444770 RepID=Z9JL25_9GAMM|nr:hypothetical protein AF72_02440 [Xylella taiwanensis]
MLNVQERHPCSVAPGGIPMFRYAPALLSGERNAVIHVSRGNVVVVTISEFYPCFAPLLCSPGERVIAG